MKMRAKGLVAITIAAVVASVAFVPGAQAAKISFDTYCDGMALKYQAIPSDPPTVQGRSIGCATGGVIGLAKPNAGGLFGPRKGTTYLMSADHNGVEEFTFQWVINKDRTFAIYWDSNNDGVIELLNSGTWSPGAPAPRGGGASAAAGASGATGALRAPGRAPLDISFDGYCDGLHLQKPSAGLGTQNTVDGNVIGSCVANVPLFGSFSNGFSGGVDAHLVILPAYDTMFRVNLDQTWSYYGATGGNSQFISPIGSGTWSPGAPARGGAAATG